MLWLALFTSLLVACFVAWLMYKADKKRAVPYPLLTASLRGLLVLLTLLLLLAPQINKRNITTQKPIVLFLQDNSQSIANALGKNSNQYRKEVTALSNKLSEKFKFVTWNLDGNTSKDSLFNYNAATTDISKALNDAAEMYGQQNLGAVILASDGQYNKGANPLFANLPINGTLYALAIGDTSVPKDLRITKIYANKTAAINSQLEIRADIVAQRCNGYINNITLLDASGNSLAKAPLSIRNDKYDGSISFSVKLSKAGLQHYILTAPDAGSEQNVANNKQNIFVDVIEEKKKILILAAAAHPDVKAINDALKGLEQYEVTTKTVDQIPDNIGDYQCIILHQLPAISNNSINQLNAQKKSTWYITGAQSNYTQLNQWQQAVTFNVSNAMRDAEPILNTAFNTFSLPQDIRSVSDKLPPLSVPYGNINASAAGNILFSQSTGQPLWVLYPGTVPCAVLCGEGLWRWRLYEYKNFNRHEAVDECIRQTISFLTANNKDKPFRAELPKYVWNNPEHVQINAYLYNSNNEPINQPDASISISDSAGHSRNFSFERNGNAYRIDIGTLPAGTYNYKAQTTLNGKTYTDAGRFVMDATSLEAQENGCNYPLLYALAQKNNGSTFNTDQINALYDSILKNNNIRPLISETSEQVPLIDWKWYFLFIVLVATAEWLLRKYWMAM